MCPIDRFDVAPSAARPPARAAERGRLRFKAAFYLSLTLGLSLLARPAFGDAMEKGPRIKFTPPPGASWPPGVTPQPSPTPSAAPSAAPSGSPAPGAGPAASPAASASPGPGASVAPEASPTPEPPAFPTPDITTPPNKGATLPTPAPSPDGSPKPKVRVNADTLTTNRNTGMTTFRGNVKVDYGQMSITSEELSVNQKDQTVSTNTRFTMSQPDPKQPGQLQVITGTGMVYHYDTQQATVNGANFSTPAEQPGQTIYLRAKTIKSFGDTRFEASDAVFSTCSEILDELVPHYHVETKYMQYFAGDKIVAWDNKVYLNGRYVFWLPVWVFPLKGQENNLNMGRTDVEGFFLRTGYNYALPSLNNGFWLNDGRLTMNLFEKKGVGLGFEHNARWGYDAATYAFFYGLATPDRANFLPPNSVLDTEMANALVKGNEKLFGLYGGPFQDHQAGIEHKQRLPWDIEVGGRFEDHNIYDPLAHNFRNNRQSLHADLKDSIPELGALSYTLSYDRTEQRGNQVPIDTNNPGIGQLSQSVSDRARGSTNFKVANTTLQVTSQYDRSHQRTRRTIVAGSDAATRSVQQADEAPVEFEVRTQEGATNSTVSNNFNASSEWGPNTRSSVTAQHTLRINEQAPPSTPPSASPLPIPTPSPWEQQLEPQFDVNHRFQNVGTLSVQGQKYLDLTQFPTALTPALQAQRLRSLNKFDRLPEVTFLSDPLLQAWQPFTVRLGYGRFFEYASFSERLIKDQVKDPNLTVADLNFPGDYINRLNMETALSSKQFDIGFNSKLDFSGTGYRQFLYSTRDAQYSIDERVTLLTNWSPAVTTNFNYTNNITPETAAELSERGADIRLTNNSPFQQDKLSLSKQTRLTGAFEVRQDPFLTYAFRSGYDYQNKQYDTISSEVSWRNRLFGLPFGLTLNGQYDVNENDEGGLKFERKTLDVRYLPEVPTFGIAGKWLPVTGTFTLRSTEDMFGGAFGADKIIPGWQLDNAMGYDFDQGHWTQLTNRLYITLGDRWQNHLQLVLGGYYETNEANRGYKFSQIGINKDLHDFILSFQYDRLASFYSVSLTMVAFPGQPLNFTSNTFDRRTGTNSTGLPGFPGL